jgi:hypothetical protein
MADDQTTRQASNPGRIEHIKNPGRVAWGRKLARMSRESKAEKKASTAKDKGRLGPGRIGPRRPAKR